MTRHQLSWPVLKRREGERNPKPAGSIGSSEPIDRAIASSESCHLPAARTSLFTAPEAFAPTEISSHTWLHMNGWPSLAQVPSWPFSPGKAEPAGPRTVETGGEGGGRGPRWVQHWRDAWCGLGELQAGVRGPQSQCPRGCAVCRLLGSAIGSCQVQAVPPCCTELRSEITVVERSLNFELLSLVWMWKIFIQFFVNIVRLKQA